MVLIGITFIRGSAVMPYELHMYLFQVHVYRQIHGAPSGNYRRCKLTANEPPAGDSTVCSFSCDCDERMCDIIFVRIFGRYGPLRSLCEIELSNASPTG